MRPGTARRRMVRSKDGTHLMSSKGLIQNKPCPLPVRATAPLLLARSASRERIVTQRRVGIGRVSEREKRIQTTQPNHPWPDGAAMGAPKRGGVSKGAHAKETERGKLNCSCLATDHRSKPSVYP